MATALDQTCLPAEGTEGLHLRLRRRARARDVADDQLISEGRVVHDLIP
jgi:hypothetical protein